jgi:hypothetical protein
MRIPWKGTKIWVDLRGVERFATSLVLLPGFEERLEIALAEAVLAASLDNLEEDWTDRVSREPPQQDRSGFSPQH